MAEDEQVNFGNACELVAWSMNSSPTLSLNVPDVAVTSASPYYQLPRCIADLNCFFALQRGFLRHEAAWLAGVPYWDAKIALGRHLLQDANNAEALLKRLHELKATSAEHSVIENVDSLVKEIASAASGDEWLRGLYTVAKPWYVAQLVRYLENCDPVMDEPSHEVLERIVANQQAQIAWFEKFTPRYSTWNQPDCSEWCDYLRGLLDDARVAEGVIQHPGLNQARPGGRPDFEVLPVVQRDSTFDVKDHRVLPLDSEDFNEKRVIMFWAHAQEMQFAESLGAILYETPEMPWAFHFDLARHLADEVRHSRMGTERLKQLGVPVTSLPSSIHNYTFRYSLDPLVRFCMMTLVMEANGFDRKRANIQLFREKKDEISEHTQAFDIKDEMMHTNFGHIWTPIMLRVYHDSRSVQELIRHCRDTLGQRVTEYPFLAAEAARST